MHTYLKWFIYSASVKILALKYMSVALLISQNNEYTGKIIEIWKVELKNIRVLQQ